MRALIPVLLFVLPMISGKFLLVETEDKEVNYSHIATLCLKQMLDFLIVPIILLTMPKNLCDPWENFKMRHNFLAPTGAQEVTLCVCVCVCLSVRV